MLFSHHKDCDIDTFFDGYHERQDSLLEEADSQFLDIKEIIKNEEINC